MFLILLFACYQALSRLYFICYSSVIDQAKDPSNLYKSTDLENTDQKSSVFHLLSDDPLGFATRPSADSSGRNSKSLYTFILLPHFPIPVLCILFFVLQRCEKTARIVSQHRNPLWIKELETGSFLTVLAVTLADRMDHTPGQPFHPGHSVQNKFRLHYDPSDQTL